ncbi:TonB-dependent receptor [Sphingomonas phyllosphaerae]|uniref:TonB-dependent receptor n=1 Tax=Sphingomonas phyllosphaerae TaxID=257003 RepID=UPI002413A8DF|nr:TonB-dependent receptor [Sphingomonas phyllosphaerae]
MRVLYLLLASAAPIAAPAPAQQPQRDLPGTVAPTGSAAATPAPGAGTAAQSSQATPATAPADAPAENEDEPADIVVTGARTQRGAVVGDITPEEQLSPADIRSYGVSSVTELLNELSPQTRSGRGAGGAPVVLLNGRRISGFQEIRDLPTEAIARVDILPEEVALKYGYRADQRVVNFVLRRRFRAVTAEIEDRLATEGGRNAPGGELDLLRIREQGRVNLHLEYNRADALTEAERDILPSPNTAAIGGNVATRGRVAIDPLFGTASSLGVPEIAATRAPLLGEFSSTRNVTDQSAYRTLLPQERTVSANGTYATTIFGNVGATLNATVDHSRTEALRGLAELDLALPVGNPFSPFAVPVTLTRAFDTIDPLTQQIETTQLHLGGTLNGDRGRWRWSVTGNVDRDSSNTVTQTGFDGSALQAQLTALDPAANPYGPLTLARAADNSARSTSTTAGLDALASGPLFALPAGDANASLRIGASTSDFSSRSVRFGTPVAADIGRDIASTQLNLDLPIASRAEGVLAFLGNLSLNGNVAADRVSDFGTLWTYGYGANWRPIEAVRLLASVTDQAEAPTAAQLGNPVVSTPGVRVFDYVRGTTATVTTVTGGNPLLVRDERHALKVGLDVKPWSARDIRFRADYTRQTTDDPIASFPSATAAIEAAFPDRYTRDAEGNLLRIDTRPINFARRETSQLRYGVNLSFRLKSKIQKELEAFRAGTGPNPFAGMRPPGERRGGEGGGREGAIDRTRPDGSAARGGDGTPAPGGNGAPSGGSGGAGAGGGPGSGDPGGGFGRFGRGGGAQAGGRLQFALYHTWHLTERVTVADSGPVLNLLDGDAIGSAGGQPRHELEGQAGYTNNGLGARISVNYQSATRVNGGTAAAPETLDFGSIATANLRLFADLGGRIDWVRAHPWMRGARVSLQLDNLFNTRQRVTDQAGEVPIGFQPGYLDPIGRTVRLSLRKLFY